MFSFFFCYWKIRFNSVLLFFWRILLGVCVCVWHSNSYLLLLLLFKIIIFFCVHNKNLIHKMGISTVENGGFIFFSSFLIFFPFLLIKTMNDVRFPFSPHQTHTYILRFFLDFGATPESRIVRAHALGIEKNLSLKFTTSQMNE